MSSRWLNCELSSHCEIHLPYRHYSRVSPARIARRWNRAYKTPRRCPTHVHTILPIFITEFGLMNTRILSRVDARYFQFTRHKTPEKYIQILSRVIIEQTHKFLNVKIWKYNAVILIYICQENKLKIKATDNALILLYTIIFCLSANNIEIIIVINFTVSYIIKPINIYELHSDFISMINYIKKFIFKLNSEIVGIL